jgi:primosomal protein N' (replication factor Y)
MMRFDADSSTESSLERSYEKLYSGEIKLIVGTQVIAKGLDLPHLKAVGIIQADAGLSLPDYSSSERTFQLIAQAVGRVGRNDQDTTVVVQSYQPTHPAIVSGTMQDYATFYDHTLKERKRGAFPPYRFLLKLTCSYKTEATAIRHATTLAKTIREHVSTSVVILGPAPAFYERQRDSYRWQLVIKSPTRQALLDVLRYMPPTHWQADIDPTSLL